MDLPPLRQRLLRLCVSGDGSYDFAGHTALKTHVTLREALEIEAVKCVAGDERHDFQEWYATEWPKLRKRYAQAATNSPVIDPAVVAEEAQQMRTALQETDAALSEHRRAVAMGQPSPFSDRDVEDMYALRESLESNLAGVEAIAAEADKGEG